MRLSVVLIFSMLALPVTAGPLTERPGWRVLASSLAHGDLVGATRAAISAEGLAVVTQAGPTGAAAARGITIPGNVVIGAFNNDFAVRVLGLSTAAMIEAPIRFYVTENADGTATLSYKTPGHVFAPYFDEGGNDLAAIASELDGLFERIARRAVADAR